MQADIAIPPRLEAGSKVAICSPSRSLGLETFGDLVRAQNALAELGLSTELPTDGAIPDEFSSSAAEGRAQQIKEAILNDDVRAILMGYGGFNAIDVLDYLDIRALAHAGPKIICGMSDISIFTTAFLAQNHWQTYYGPNFTIFGRGPELAHTVEGFKNVMMQPPTDKVALLSAPTYGEEKGDRKSESNYVFEDEGPVVVNPGKAEGVIFGGNLGTLFLLQGTDYWPESLGSTILFVEDDDLSGKHTLEEALRRLRSLIIQPNLRGNVAGLVMGRFQKGANAPLDLIKQGLREIAPLRDVPIVIHTSFGHTNPMATIPIGGWAWLEASSNEVQISMACVRS